MPKNENREYRNMTMEVVRDEMEGETESMRVEGYASTFDDPYTLYEDEDLIYMVKNELFVKKNLQIEKSKKKFKAEEPITVLRDDNKFFN